MKKLLIGLFFLACTAFSYASSGKAATTFNAEKAVKKEMAKLGMSSASFKIKDVKKDARDVIIIIIDVYDEDGNYLGTIIIIIDVESPETPNQA